MELTNISSNSKLQTAKERMKEKINGNLKAAKFQTSLAAKIKSKNFNNSSVLKISLKHNNRALACALTAEKEKARILESDKMILQKEVKMLHFQNAVLRQNLSIVNRMLKDIDIFMNVNLPAAIEISSLSESSDVLATEERKSERFSHESRLSVDELQEFRLTGMALRVPTSSTEQQKCSGDPTFLLNEEKNNLHAPRPTDFSTATENSDEEHEVETKTSFLTAKERLSSYNKNVICNSSLNMKVNSVLPPEEDMISHGRSGGFVTRRRRRSTACRSSTQSVNSDFNQSKNSLGIGRESCCSTQWDISKHDNLPPEPGHLDVTGGSSLQFDFVMRKDVMSEMSCSPLSKIPDTKFDAKEKNKVPQVNMETTRQPELLNSGEGDLHPIVDRHVEQERTVYEADMEMTSSDSATIVAVMPKRKTKTSKSNIPVKQDGTSLRKVKKTANEKTKEKSSCKGKESNMSSKIKEENEMTLKIEQSVPMALKPSADMKTGSTDICDSRRTFVLPASVNRENVANIFESETQVCPAENEARPALVCSAEESFIENSPLGIKADFKLPGFRPDSTNLYDIRRTYILPGPLNKDRSETSDSKIKLNPGKNEAKPSVVSSLEESFAKTSYSCDSNSDLIFATENMHSSDVEHSTNDTVAKKRKSKLDKRPAKDMENSKKKRKVITNKDLKHIGEDQEGHTLTELHNARIMDTNPSFGKKEPCIRRETYVLSSTKSNFVLPEFIPKDVGIYGRRDTFVIPEANDISVSDENAEIFDHPSLKSGKAVQPITEDVIGIKKTDLNIVSHGLDTDFNKPSALSKFKFKEINQNQNSSNFFFQLDKKTCILPENKNDFSNDKITLVRESCVNVTKNDSSKATKVLGAVMANEQDSFMLDMVSESILDGTLDCPSFVDFPSTSNLESAFIDNVSLNNIPPLDPPISDERDTMENEQPNASKSLDALDENDNGLAQEIFEAESLCKVENQSMEINEAELKPFQDLTNKSRDSTKQSPKSCTENQEEAQAYTRRRRNPVNYKEPSLGTKLRRGDTNTNTEFLNSPPSKGKGKKGGNRKKKIKSEECPTNSV